MAILEDLRTYQQLLSAWACILKSAHDAEADGQETIRMLLQLLHLKPSMKLPPKIVTSAYDAMLRAAFAHGMKTKTLDAWASLVAATSETPFFPEELRVAMGKEWLMKAQEDYTMRFLVELFRASDKLTDLCMALKVGGAQHMFYSY